MDTVHDFDQLRRLARRRLPRFAFDFVDGGAGREAAVERNQRAFADAEITPDPLHAAGRSDPRCTLFGQAVAAPFAIAPMGGLGLLGADADIAIARAAAVCGIPHVLSAVSNTALESVTTAAERPSWLQVYCPRERSLLFELVDRARAQQCPVLVLTVDMPAVGRRLRDAHNGLAIPFRWSWRTVLDAASRPHWSLGQLRRGPLDFPNLRTDDTGGDLATRMALQTGGRIDWELVAALRDRWHGALLLKGVESPALAIRARQLGCDGVIVSNHGGRQLDGALATLHACRAVAEATGDGVTAIDSGLRNGEDLLKARLAGARFGLYGRPVAFAYAAGGERAVILLLRTLISEYACARVQAGEGSPHVRLHLRGAGGSTPAAEIRRLDLGLPSIDAAGEVAA
jgi:isopentenyl diphosphate isomerase/L-lactate dehydrogenase-like FMN-dependent dehydrogenase